LSSFSPSILISSNEKRMSFSGRLRVSAGTTLTTQQPFLAIILHW
jgi:hypothetical protein